MLEATVLNHYRPIYSSKSPENLGHHLACNIFRERPQVKTTLFADRIKHIESLTHRHELWTGDIFHGFCRFNPSLQSCNAGHVNRGVVICLIITIPHFEDDNAIETCCGQLWVRHMFCGRDMWWTIPLHIFHWSCWDTQKLTISTLAVKLSVSAIFYPWVTATNWLSHILGRRSWLSGYLGLSMLVQNFLWLPYFWESLVFRLHSKIGQIHLSIEAQCDNHSHTESVICRLQVCSLKELAS